MPLRIFLLCALTLLLQGFLFLAGADEREWKTFQALLADSQMHQMIGPEPEASIREHFGDPDHFMKYIIQKPPVYV